MLVTWALWEHKGCDKRWHVKGIINDDQGVTLVVMFIGLVMVDITGQGWNVLRNV